MGVYKFNEERQKCFLDLLSVGGRRGASATAVGISRSTICDLMREDKEFASAVLQAEMDANDVIETVLYGLAKDGDMKAVKMWLYNKNKSAWRDKQAIEVSGPDGGPLNTDDLSGLSNAELRERLELLKGLEEEDDEVA